MCLLVCWTLVVKSSALKQCGRGSFPYFSVRCLERFIISATLYLSLLLFFYFVFGGGDVDYFFGFFVPFLFGWFVFIFLKTFSEFLGPYNTKISSLILLNIKHFVYFVSWFVATRQHLLFLLGKNILILLIILQALGNSISMLVLLQDLFLIGDLYYHQHGLPQKLRLPQ